MVRFTRPRKARRAQPEGLIVNACLRWLLFHGVYCWRQNTGAYRNEATGALIRYGHIGSADIIGLIGGNSVNAGKFIAIEAKTEKGRQSEAQLKFEENIKGCGGFYFVAKGIDDLERFVKPLL